jgi:uncharacterized membrane protein (UPF0136 family)
MKLTILWSLFIGSCIGEIATLLLEQYGRWQTVGIYLIVMVPAVLLTVYSKRVMHPRKKPIPRRASRVARRTMKVVR